MRLRSFEHILILYRYKDIYIETVGEEYQQSLIVTRATEEERQEKIREKIEKLKVVILL